MSDLISRQAALEILEKEGHKWGNDYRDWVNAIEEIKKLQPINSTKTGHWIPVSERLPELDELDTTVWKQKIMITGYLSFDNKKELFVSEAFIKDVINNSVHDTVVIAWMPLPEPYKPQESTEVNELPSVTPQSKTGHWIKRPHGFKCSHCLIVHKQHSIYCPSCGFRMVEPQERSDKG